MRRYRTIPPLQFLLGFEAAARLGSFTKAAKELGLSQSAVSHEMRLLEDRIGQPLFLRVGRTVQLTDAGYVYQRVVREALDGLDAAQHKLAPFRRESSVVIYAPRDFGRLWLAPRLGNLLQACPQVQPWLDTSGSVVDFSSVEVSIGIIHAREAPTDLLFMKLVDDRRAPLAAPALAENGLLGLDALAAMPLIHDEKLPGWQQFFELHGLVAPLGESAMDFSDSDAALVAAEAGLGIVLGNTILASEAIAARRLSLVSSLSIETQYGWYAVTNEAELNNPFTKMVWTWLGQQAAG